MNNKNSMLELSASIVAAYVGNNIIQPTDLPNLIAAVHEALCGCRDPKMALAGNTVKPAVPVSKSVFDDYLICLEDGQKFKSLKRHLRAKYNLSPDAYREKWGLPPTYPMVAPEYAKTRSALARQIGLGRGRKKKQ